MVTRLQVFNSANESVFTFMKKFFVKNIARQPGNIKQMSINLTGNIQKLQKKT